MSSCLGEEEEQEEEEEEEKKPHSKVLVNWG